MANTLKSPAIFKGLDSTLYVILNGKSYYKNEEDKWVPLTNTPTDLIDFFIYNEVVYIFSTTKLYYITYKYVLNNFSNPIDIATETIKELYVRNNRLFLITDDNLYYYDSSTKVWVEESHVDNDILSGYVENIHDSITKEDYVWQFEGSDVFDVHIDSEIDINNITIETEYQDALLNIGQNYAPTDVQHTRAMYIMGILDNRAATPAYIGKSLVEFPLRKIVHDDKVLKNDKTSLDLSSNEVYNEASSSMKLSAAIADESKHSVTSHKIIFGCQTGEIVPLMELTGKTADYRNSNKNNSDLTSLLIEIRISAPRLNFKGYITTGLIDSGKYGIGFFSEYLHNEYPNTFLKAYLLDTGKIYICMVNRGDESLDDLSDGTNANINKKYVQMFPIDIHVTPLICESIEFDYNFDDIINESDILGKLVGTGDLTDIGHGPIDCEIDDHTVIRRCDSVYYESGNKSNCEMSGGVNLILKQQSIDHIRVLPYTYSDGTPSQAFGSEVLSPGYDPNYVKTKDNKNMGIYNLFRTLYVLEDTVQYKVRGFVMMNKVHIPIESLVVDNRTKKCYMMISPYFKLPVGKFSTVALTETDNYDHTRKPYIIFDYGQGSYDGDIVGMIGDVGHKIDGSYVTIGSDEIVAGDKNTYSLNMIDIIIFFDKEHPFQLVETDSVRYNLTSDLVPLPTYIDPIKFSSYAYPDVARAGEMEAGKDLETAGMPSA